jgi:hypothetical protein
MFWNNSPPLWVQAARTPASKYTPCASMGSQPVNQWNRHGIHAMRADDAGVERAGDFIRGQAASYLRSQFVQDGSP